MRLVSSTRPASAGPDGRQSTSTRSAATSLRSRSLRRLFILAALFLVAGDVLFWFTYAGVASYSGLALLDVPVHDAIVGARSPAATAFFSAITAVTSPAWTAAAAVATALAWTVWKREFWRQGLLLASMALAAGLAEFIKHDVGRIRPSAADFLLGPNASFSFPSGHTVGTGVFLFVLAYLLTSRLGRRGSSLAASPIRTRRAPWTAWAVAAGTTALVSLSRLYLGYHWLTDVVASTGLACAVTGLAMLADCVRGSLARPAGSPGSPGPQGSPGQAGSVPEP